MNKANTYLKSGSDQFMIDRCDDTILSTVCSVVVQRKSDTSAHESIFIEIVVYVI